MIAKLGTGKSSNGSGINRLVIARLRTHLGKISVGDPFLVC